MNKTRTKTNKQPTLTVQNIPIAQIIEPEEPLRTTINKDDLEQLAASIQAIGLLEPIALKPKAHRYEIIFGHRRFLAFQLLNRLTIPSIIIDMQTDKVLISRVHENINRADITPYDEAIYLNLLQTKYSFSNKRLSVVMGRSQAYISQRLQILNYPTNLKNALKARQINFTIARLLNQIKDPATLKIYLDSAIKQGANEQTVHEWISLYKKYEEHKHTPELPQPQPDILEEHIPPTQNCYFCDGKYTYDQLKNIYTCKTCLAAIIDQILNTWVQPTHPPKTNTNQDGVTPPKKQERRK